MSQQILLDGANFGGCGWGFESCGGCRAEVAQLVRFLARLQDVLHFQVAVEQGRLEVVHARDSFEDLDEDGEDFGLGEPFSQSPVHHVDDASSGAVLHEDKHLMGAVRVREGR